jgi:hypothetical protein
MAEAQAVEALQMGTRITVAAEAADAYMQIRGAQVRLSFAKDQISSNTHLVELVQQRRDAGIASDRETRSGPSPAVARQRHRAGSYWMMRGFLQWKVFWRIPL